MKVVLCAVNGSWSHTNLAIRCLRPPLEREGFQVVLREHSLRERTEHILEALEAEKGDIYGFSCYIWNLPLMLELAEALKSVLPSCRVVLGGPEVSFGTERFEHLPWLDGVVCGEGETAFRDLCLAMSQGKKTPLFFRAQFPITMGDEGILYRKGEQTGGILYYESSRGCPFRCAYCLSGGAGALRMKSVEQTLGDLKEFEALDDHVRIIKFVDRTFNADRERANRIWEALLSPDFTKHYHFEICASLLNEESYEILSRFPKGKIQLEIGLQSTNPATLEAVSRHISPQEVLSAVKRIYERGNIHVHLDLIAGLPYEGYERFAQSFNEAYGSCHLLQLGFLKLLHGTVLREKAEEYGYAHLPSPPYTVLKSKWISYEEMRRLSRIAQVLERYEESGKFSHTLAYLLPLAPSPFAFWEGLAEDLKHRAPHPVQLLSQPDAFRYLMEYALKQYPVEKSTLRERLSLDFTIGEHGKRLPLFLRQE